MARPVSPSALVLGVAFGARATRVEVRQARTGALLQEASARHDEGGANPLDPTAWWRSLTQAIAAAGKPEVAALAVAGGHPGLVLLDNAGTVLRPMQPWPDDEVAAEALALRERLGDAAWARHTGALPGPASAVSRLAWLHHHDPGSFSQVGAVLLPHDWLTYRLCGRLVTDRGSASLTGAWSPSTGTWSHDALRAIAPRARPADRAAPLAAVVGPDEPADWLTAPVFELLGLRGRPLVAPGTGEPMAIALALGLRPGRRALVLGAGTTALTGLAHAVADPSGQVRSRADATGAHLAVSSLVGGTGLLATLAALLQVDAEGLGALALQRPLAAGDPVVLPWVPGRRHALVELPVGATAATLARAVLEGLAASGLDALDRVPALDGGPTGEGALHLVAPDAPVAALAQVMADLAGEAVVAAPADSMAAAGACVQAASVLRGEPPAEVAEEWSLGAGPELRPRPMRYREERRRRHQDERARQSSPG